MKYVYILLSLLISLEGLAIAPTTPAKNLTVNTREGTYLNIGWGAGNGTRRVIIARAGAPVQSKPQNGKDYRENNNFGDGEQLLPGEYVIYDNAFTSFYVTGLASNTTYYFAIFEYNGTGANTEYLLDPYLAASAATAATPALQASGLSFKDITTSSVKAEWAAGDGSRRLVVVRKDAPVNTDPADLHTYNANSNFQSGGQVGTGNYAVYASTQNAVIINNLTPNTTYYFAIYEYNGSSEPVYLRPAFTGSVTTRAAPTVPSKDLEAVKIDGTELHFSWTRGNGARRIMVAKQGSPITGIPQNGKDYQYTPIFGGGETIAPDEYVVYDNNGTACYVSNLAPFSTYYFKVFEYDGTGTGTVYLTSSFAATTTSTAVRPTVQTTDLSAINITGNSLLLKWAKGDGQGRFVVAHKNAPVNILPQDLKAYFADSDFGEGEQIGSGNYVIANSLDDGGINIHKLDPNTTYHFAVFEYNGQLQPLYLSPSATFSATTLTVLPVKLTEWKLLNKEKQVELSWTTGMEENASHFNVQRSTDGIHFTTIAKINASGNSQSSVNYSWLDKSPLAGQNYYRLEMVDIDEKTEYSSVLSVTVSTVVQARLLNNPVDNKIVALLPVSASTKTEWRIINTGGQVISQGITTSARLEISSFSLKPGNYWLQIINERDKESIGFIKL